MRERDQSIVYSSKYENNNGEQVERYLKETADTQLTKSEVRRKESETDIVEVWKRKKRECV